MRHKIGVQFQWWGNDVQEWAIQCQLPWMKFIGFLPGAADLATLRREIPGVKIIYRPVEDLRDNSPYDVEGPGKIIRNCQSHPGADFYEGFNEYEIHWGYAEAANRMETDIAERMKAIGLAYLPICMSTGQPPSHHDPQPYESDPGAWAQGMQQYCEGYKGAVQACDGRINMHCYHHPGPGELPAMHEYRYRFWPDWVKEIYITETGWDAGGHGAGFRKYTDLGTYMVWIREYNRELCKDGRVQCAIVFEGTGYNWPTFTLFADVRDGIRYDRPDEEKQAWAEFFQSLAEDDQPEEPVVPPKDPEWFGRFAAMAHKMGTKAGSALTGPIELNDVDQRLTYLQLGTQGLFYWCESRDAGLFVPATHAMGPDGVLQPKPIISVGVKLLIAAERYLGQPYVFGGLDCSQLVVNALNDIGINAPDMTVAQICDSGFVEHISGDKIKIGDLIVFHNTYEPPSWWPASKPFPSHVGINAGKGKMLESSHGTGAVVYTDFTSDVWLAHNPIFMRVKE